MSVEPTRAQPLLHPGTYVEEWLEDSDMRSAELATRLGVSPKHVSRVLNGHDRITPEFAAKLDLVTDIPLEFWLVHQAKYDARTAVVTVTAADIAEVKQFFPNKCLAPLRKAGLITHTWRNGEELVREIFRKLQVASTAAMRETLGNLPVVAYRQSAAFEVEAGALRAWLWLVEKEVEELGDLPAYSEAKLRESIPALRRRSMAEPASFVSSTANILHACGVGFVALPDLPGARVSGASFLREGSPIICVTDKYKREDAYWFTLFHEIAHVLHDDISSPLIDLGDEENDKSAVERAADEWASESLVPAGQVPKNPSLHDVRAHALRLGVSPGILVGRLQHLGVKPHSWGRDLIRSFSVDS